MSRSCPCPVRGHECGTLIPDDRFMCTECVGRFRELLVSIPDLLDDLDVQVARLNVTGPTLGTSGTKTQPIPYNEYAADIRTDLIGALRGVYIATGYTTYTDPVGMVEALVNQMGKVGAREQAPDLYDEIRDAVRRGNQACGTPPERRDYGPCSLECDTRIVAPISWTNTTCPTCGREHDLTARTQDRLDATWNAHAPIAVVAKVLTELAAAGRLTSTVKISQQNISDWIRDGLLESFPSPDGRPEHHVRVRDVRDVATMSRADRGKARRKDAA